MSRANELTQYKEHPIMIRALNNFVYQTAFCFALATESHISNKLLFTIIGGNDTTLQAIKGCIDSGWQVSAGHGVETTTGYEFMSEFSIGTEKGMYEKIPMNLAKNRKAIAFIHEDILLTEKFVLSLTGNPQEDVRHYLGSKHFGLNILPEWEDVIYNELLNRNYLLKHEIYVDELLFPEGIVLLENNNFTEEMADELVSELIQSKRISFPVHGTGSSLEEVTSLTDYLLQYNEVLIEKLSQRVEPTHDPIKDEILPNIATYKREPFPVQSHVISAISKRLQKQKSLILQGEMSTGKSLMSACIVDSVQKLKGKEGYFACIMCPPSLTKKWAEEEIHFVIPGAEVHHIEDTSQLIQFHQEWTNKGRPKPTVPTFFVISFTTMSLDCSIEPAINYSYKKTEMQKKLERNPYKMGYYCMSCGNKHQVVESKDVEVNEDGEEKEVLKKRPMLEEEFGSSRRIKQGKNPANAFCSECGENLWTKRVQNRYSSFKNWSAYANKVEKASKKGDKGLLLMLKESQPEIKSKKGQPRRVASIEYIRRKMKNFFDVSVVDEVHMTKGGLTAIGNALGSLVAASKKCLGATGTLFGGKAIDIYYLLWRMFPQDMIKAGYSFEENTRFSKEFGNVETTIYGTDDKEYSNSQSRGGVEKSSTKIIPGISPSVYGKFLIHNSVLVQLSQVWQTDVELVDVPTIFVDMNPELKEPYQQMIQHFERLTQDSENGHKMFLPMISTGIAYPDNPSKFPDVTMKLDGIEETLWESENIDENLLLNKEKKLQEIVTSEMNEGRASIVYVRDTGSSSEGRDVRPRLKAVLEQVGAKVAILDTSTTATNARSKWLKKKVENEGYNVIIVSTELVKVGLDLLCTPTLIFYQFHWSLYTLNQAARRAYRIGQTKECRLFYLAYRDTYQEYIAQLIAQKNKAAQALNGEVSSDGLSAMLGNGEEDLMSMLIKSIKKGKKLKGTAEEWIEQSSSRAKELLTNIDKGVQRKVSLFEQFINWVNQTVHEEATLNVLSRKGNLICKFIESGEINGFVYSNGKLTIDLVEAFGIDFVDEGQLLAYLTAPERQYNQMIEAAIIETPQVKSTRRSKMVPIEGQLAFELF